MLGTQNSRGRHQRTHDDSVEHLSQVDLLTECEVVHSELRGGEGVQVTLDLRECSQPATLWGYVADVHSNLVRAHALTNQTTPAVWIN